MSETGIYSSRYELLRRFGDLLNEVLLRVHIGNSSLEDPERKELVKLLIKAAIQPSSDRSEQREELAALDCEGHIYHGGVTVEGFADSS
jgi:hypothetical protein